MMDNDNFQPKIIAFLCKWTTYAAADLCGVSRMPYVPNVNIIRVNCTGQVSADMLFTAFENGADGVLIGGCRPGHCRHGDANMQTERRVYLLKRAIGEFGLNPDRIRVVGIAGAQALLFQKTVNKFTEDLRALGPSPVIAHAR